MLKDFNSILFGKFLIPRHTSSYVKTSKSLSELEWVEKYNTYSRRIFIRDHNGKIYSFFISNESNYYECRKKIHKMQLMRMINTYRSKQKETSRRNLHFTLPRIASLPNLSDFFVLHIDCVCEREK